jgi:hypothetical protein
MSLSLHQSAFYSELMALGKLKQVPLRRLDYAAIIAPIDVMLKSPIGIDCSHTQKCSVSFDFVGQRHRLLSFIM